MKLLRALEAGLVRVEGAVAVALVLLMLALAGYNVLYRNVLVPLQKHWAHSGPIPEAPPPPPPKPTVAKTDDAAKEPSAAEGFAGDWGEGGDEEDDDEDVDAKAKPEPEPSAAEGFAGDWGEGGDEEDDEAKDAAKSDVKPADAKTDDADDEDESFDLAKIDAVAKTEDGEPLGGPPAPGSFAANMVALIDSIKLAWIDVVLRQLVILVAFFGAMMATQRGKHINVDALSKLLGPDRQRWLSVVTNSLATGVCLVFAKAGSALVGISREHPHELVPWADEWVFQLMFPVGFGLLAFHFAVRVVEAATGTAPEPTGGAA